MLITQSSQTVSDESRTTDWAQLSARIGQPTVAEMKAAPVGQPGIAERKAARVGQPGIAERKAAASDAADSWEVLPDSMMVNAMSPRKPTNQLVQPDLDLTRPTCPYTGTPARSAALAAPARTAPSMRPRRASSVPGSSAVPALAGGSAGFSMNCGVCQLPESTAAATMAMDSGLIRTSPWPIVSAATSASPPMAGTDPEKAGTCSCDQSAPIPNSFTARVSLLALSRSDSPANTVPQPSANSALNGFSSPVPSLVNVWPPTEKEFSQEIWADGFSPVASSAAADTMVNAMPGASFASRGPAAGSAPEAWCWATART